MSEILEFSTWRENLLHSFKEITTEQEFSSLALCYPDNKSNKGDVIAENIKPGDVVIFKNGISHTGIVESVNSDGSFTTIEGNTSDKVATRHYAANDSRVSGFVQLA